MKRTLLALTLVGFGISAPALAGPLEDQFFTMDSSRDGTVTREEFVAFQTRNGATERQANFAFDNTAGDDSRITLTEFRAGPQIRTRTQTQTRTRATSTRRSSPTRSTTRSRSRGGS